MLLSSFNTKALDIKLFEHRTKSVVESLREYSSWGPKHVKLLRREGKARVSQGNVPKVGEHHQKEIIAGDPDEETAG